MSPPTRETHGRGVRAPSEAGFVPEDEERPKRGNARVKNTASPEPAEPKRRLVGLISALKLLSGVLIVIAVSSAVAYGAYRYALTTPRFGVRSVQIEGSRRLSDEQVTKLAGIEIGKNIFQVDTEVAERLVLENPWVREAKITRQLPATIRIELGEREAYALAAIADQLYLVSKTGEPFKRFEAGDPYDLPIITGISADELARDRDLEIERIGQGLELLRAYERVPLSQIHAAQEVSLGDDGRANLLIGNAGITLELGKGPWRKKLLMAARVMDQLGKKSRAPSIVFLDNQAHPERVVVRLR